LGVELVEGGTDLGVFEGTVDGAGAEAEGTGDDRGALAGGDEDGDAATDEAGSDAGHGASGEWGVGSGPGWGTTRDQLIARRAWSGGRGGGAGGRCRARGWRRAAR